MLQTLAPIEGLIRKRVEDVEPGDPGRDREGDCDQKPPGIAPPAGHREPSPHWRDRQAQSEPQVRPPGKPLGEAVRHDPGERERTEHEADRIEQRRGGHEEPGRDAYRDPCLAERERSTRQLAIPGARVARVVGSVGDPVEPHRHPASAGERDDHQQDRADRYRCVERRGDETEQREWEREQGVGKLYEAGVAGNQRFAGEGLALPGGELPRHWSLVRRRIPSSGHISSTLCFVAASITIGSGHSRSNPSSVHLRVASIPILLP